MRTPLSLVLSVTVFFLISFSACKSGPERKENAKPETESAKQLTSGLAGAPDWVLKGCGAFFGEKKAVVCGVGSVSGQTNLGLARSAAQGRGRTEIARTLQVRVKSMLKDYQAATMGGADDGLSNEQHIEDVSKQVTNMTLSGVKLHDTWISGDGTLFALMILDVEEFKDTLEKAGELNARVRKAIQERANASFGELDRETEGSPAG